MATTLGPKMREALDYVTAHPGCTKLAVAKEVGPHGSTHYGYAIVNRLIASGAVRAYRAGVRYELYPEVRLYPNDIGS